MDKEGVARGSWWTGGICWNARYLAWWATVVRRRAEANWRKMKSGRVVLGELKSLLYLKASSNKLQSSSPQRGSRHVHAPSPIILTNLF